jgi:cyanate lyase
MSRKTTQILATGAAVLALAGGGSAVAYAAGGSGSSSRAAKASRDLGPPGHAGFLQAVSSYLGLTSAEIRTQREAGKSLAQIATAQGKSVAGLETAIYDAAKADLDKAVAAGRITSAQEETMLTRLKANLDEIVNRTGPPPVRAGRGHHAPVVQAAASYLGLTRAELRTQREAGKSLAQIATAQGKSVAGLKQAIYDAAKARLDKGVAAGRITSAQQSAILAELNSRLDDIVNSVGPPARP